MSFSESQSSLSTLLLLELIRCVAFQSLKSDYNEILIATFLPQQIQNQLPPYILGKVKRNIGENFHRWYFDAAGTTTTTTTTTSVARASSSPRNNDEQHSEDPLLIAPSRLFHPAVKQRLIDTIKQTLTVPKQQQLQSAPSSESIESALQKIQNRYTDIFSDFSSSSSALLLRTVENGNRATTGHNNNNTQVKLEHPSTSQNSSSVYWVCVDPFELLMSEKNTNLFKCLENSKVFSQLSFFGKNNNNNNNGENYHDDEIKLPIEQERLFSLAKGYHSGKDEDGDGDNEDQNSSSSVTSMTTTSLQDQSFLKSVMRMLLRYSALSDEKLQYHLNGKESSNNNNNNHLHRNFVTRSNLSGLGQHSAVPASVMKVIGECMGVSFECFASPLNAYFSRFCSAFKDTDACFGSVGSFFEENEVDEDNDKNDDDDEKNTTKKTIPKLQKTTMMMMMMTGSFFSKGVSFELNPPFVEDVMEKARQRAEQILQYGEEHNIPFSFNIFLPHWVSPPTPCITNIRRNDSAFLRAEMVLKPNEHGYIDGSQHRVGRGSAQYNAGHESVIFVLQNTLGKSRWPFTKQIEEKIRAAFGEAVVAMPHLNNNNYKDKNKSNKQTDQNRRVRE